MAKIQALDEKMAALAKKEERAQDDIKDGETADGTPTADDADDE